MSRHLLWLGVVAMVAAPAAAETNFELQAVNADGELTHPKVDADPIEDNLVVVEGICLNNPEDMVDPASEWQIFVQGEGDDLGGTAAWAGKFYQDSIWDDELARLNGSGFRAGDRVRVTGYAMSAGGKANINERHAPAPPMNFEVELLAAGVGLPEPEMTTLLEMNTFDPTRLTGGERYQCRRIRIDHVVIADLPGGEWGGNHDLIVADADDPENPDKQILLSLRNVDFGSQPPATWFHVTGLGDQEPLFDGGPVPGTGLVDGYQVWVTRADGILVPGDATCDGRVDGADYTAWADHYQMSGLGWEQGDYNGDTIPDGADYTPWADNYGYGPPPAGAPAPEPCSALLLAGGLWAISRRRKWG